MKKLATKLLLLAQLLKQNMKRIIPFLIVLLSTSAFAQVQDDFSDGDFTENPTWIGTTENFIVSDKQVRLNLNSETSTSYLATKSHSIKNAEWDGWFRINCATSSGNYSCFYLTAMSEKLYKTKGYFVMIGNTEDEISLYRQDSTSATKIIDGIDKRLGATTRQMIKVTHDSLGVWKLYSKYETAQNYILEGSVVDTTYRVSNYTGFLCVNSASNSAKYYFDSIRVSGGVYPASSIRENEELVVVPTIPNQVPSSSFGMDKFGAGDLVINEVLFNASELNEEFVEIFNKSEKQLNLGGLKLTTRKTDKTLNTGYKLPNTAQIEPYGYLALCKTQSKDSLYFNCPTESRFAYMSSWPSLNNDGATIVLSNTAGDTIYDELSYSPKWHHVLIKNNQGVSLERINPNLPSQSASSWHSASSEVNYATPGYQNSQYQDLSKTKTNGFWLENENFTPNNDGDKDVLFLHYQMPDNGWMANITIFDASGQIIRKLSKSYLMSAEGIISWDGKTDDDRLANIGIYVIYIETFNPNTGDSKRIKLPCVVSGK